jgi:hypothetical protein
MDENVHKSSTGLLIFIILYGKKKCFDLGASVPKFLPKKIDDDLSKKKKYMPYWHNCLARRGK